MPGPGNYEATSTFNNKAFTFNKEKSPGISSLTPGPGAYESQD